MGVPVVLADPRDLDVRRQDADRRTARKSISLYRRVLINDIVARPKECDALVKAYEANAVCVANTFRCKIPHVKAFFAVLTDERTPRSSRTTNATSIREHIPWTRVVADVSTAHYGEPIELLAFIRKERENLVLKPSDEYGGTGVTLGWETNEKAWDATIEKAVSAAKAGGDAGCWIVQERIPIRREVFPYITQARQRRIQRHARRLRPLSLPRQTLRLPHAPQRHRPRQRNLRRRPSPRLPRHPRVTPAASLTASFWLRTKRVAATFQTFAPVLTAQYKIVAELR